MLTQEVLYGVTLASPGRGDDRQVWWSRNLRVSVHFGQPIVGLQQSRGFENAVPFDEREAG